MSPQVNYSKSVLFINTGVATLHYILGKLGFICLVTVFSQGVENQLLNKRTCSTLHCDGSICSGLMNHIVPLLCLHKHYT